MPSNAWLRFRYTFWAPHYDRVTKLHPQRRRSIELLALQPGERVAVIGFGTGTDLPLLPDGSFDAAVLHMVLEVIPDPARCLSEAARVLRPGGRVAVFDKFLPDGARPGPLRRAFLALLDFVFTSTNRQMGEILARSGAPLVVAHDEPTVGAYRHVILRKQPW